MAIAKTCPICHGCGRTSLHPYTGQPVAQPNYVSGDSTAPGWTICVKCNGTGCIPLIEGQRFANGLLVEDYLRNRFLD